MVQPKITILCEGHSDVDAAPLLIRRIKKDLFREGAQEKSVSVQNSGMRVGQFSKLLRPRNDGTELEKKLLLATRQVASGIILLIDGDALPPQPQGVKCPFGAAKALVEIARRAGAGQRFSFASVFAMQEFETWMIAGARSISANDTSGKYRLREDVNFPLGNIEEHPRNAKDWFVYNMRNGYTPTADLKNIVQLADLHEIQNRNLRSFRRLENAVHEICTAVVRGVHVATPE